MNKGRLLGIIICLISAMMVIVLVGALCGLAFAEYTCEEGFVLEQKDGKYNCRNRICDAGLNFYGEAKDKGMVFPESMKFDKNGKARPIGKDSNGKWVGWTIGAYQCPPDPLGIHPNPNYVLDSRPPLVPKNIRIANANPMGRK